VIDTQYVIAGNIKLENLILMLCAKIMSVTIHRALGIRIAIGATSLE
jgi:hypothetical protein